jgi:hypothetical protein
MINPSGKRVARKVMLGEPGFFSWRCKADEVGLRQ